MALGWAKGPLVGRAEELGSLEEALDWLGGERAHAISVVGEPGIGKTRLLSELTERAEARGHLVLSGSASELERDLPFSVFVDALDEYLAGRARTELAVLADDVQAELAPVFPSLATLAPTREVALQHERYRSHRAVRALLEQLAGPRPLVFVLDDLHWADSASVELLGALLRRPPGAAVLLALALRPRQIPERLAAALERAFREGALTRLELGALTPAEARELVGGSVGAAGVDVLYEESGGNPFYLEQLARSPDRAGRAAVADSSLGDVVVPSVVAASLADELTLLSKDVRLVLEGAAVAGDPFEPELAAAAAGAVLSDAAVMDALDELLRLDLVRSTTVPRRFRFRHPLVRRAVYDATRGGWRLGAHERCAQALAARDATAAVRAHHVEQSAREGDLEAVAVLREAGVSAARLAPASAARWFAQALRLLPPSAQVLDRVDLLLAQATALAADGRFEDGHSALLDALATVPDDSVALRAAVTAACARVEHLLGDYDQARGRLLNELEALPEPVSAEAVSLLIELGLVTVNLARYDELRGLAERALETARLVGLQPLIASALAMRALADAIGGDGGRVEGDISAARAVIDALGDDEFAQRLDAGVWLIVAEFYSDRFADADAHLDRALRVARATGQGELLLFFFYLQGRVWCMRGKLAEAAQLLDGAVEAARVLRNKEELAWSLYNRSAVALAAGDLELALAAAEESVDLTDGVPENYVTAWAAVRLAATLAETGRHSEAIELLHPSPEGDELALIPPAWRPYCLELATRCWLALGRSAEAKGSAARAQRIASAVKLPLAAAWADRAAAAVELEADPLSAAERALASAIAADEAGALIEGAVSRTLAGRAFARAGDRDRAVAELEHAARRLDACGAVRYRDDAERALGKLGYRIRRRTRSGKTDGGTLEVLTERELQLARLVADRKTNPQIASELVLSVKTVETHLRNIFRKLDVASRVELARTVERANRAAAAP